jgi:hypothetical protein
MIAMLYDGRVTTRLALHRQGIGPPSCILGWIPYKTQYICFDKIDGKTKFRCRSESRVVAKTAKNKTFVEVFDEAQTKY